MQNLYRAYEKDDKREAKQIIKELDETGIRHPYVEARRVWLVEGDQEATGRIFDYIEKTFVLLLIALKEQKKYIEAKGILAEMEDPNARMKYVGLLEEIEQGIIEICEVKRKNNDISEDEIYALVLAYMGRGKAAEAKVTMELLHGKEKWEVKMQRLKMFFLKERDWKQMLQASQELIHRLSNEEVNEDYQRYLAEAYMTQGGCLLRCKQKNAGIDSMDKAMELQGKKEMYLFQKASVLMGVYLYELAADVFSELLLRNPRSLLYRFGRGKCYFEVGELQEAHNDFEYVCMMEEEDITAYIYLAKIYLQAEMWEDAEELFELFKEKGWNSDSVQLLHGLYEEARGELKKAEKILEKLLVDYDSQQSDLEHIGEIYLHLAQIAVERGKRGFTVFKYLKKGIEAEPDYLPLLEKRWELNELFEDEEDVEKDIKRILELSPYHEKANEKMSDIFEEAGKLEEAKEYLNVRQERSVGNYLDNAVNEIQGGHFEEAWKNICLAESCNTDEEGIHAVKALYYSAIGKDEKVLEEYGKYMQEGDTSFRAEMACANCHLGNYDEARRYCCEMLLADDKDEAYEMLYELELECGNYKAASGYLKEWKKARKKTILNYRFQVNSARICLAKQEYLKAKLLLDETELFDEKGNELMSALLLYQGKEKKAVKILREGIKDWPNHIELYYYLALGYLLMGDYKKAQELLEKALEMPVCSECMQCQCHEVHLQMALLYHMMGDEKKSRAYLEQAGRIKENDLDYVGILKMIMKRKI